MCERLRAARLDGFVRRSEAPDRSAMRRAIRQGQADVELLGLCGLRWTEGGERFHCHLHPPLPAQSADHEARPHTTAVAATTSQTARSPDTQPLRRA